MSISIVPFPFEPAGENIDFGDFPEPSGIVFHGGRGTLFVVGDEGAIQEMKTSGEVLRRGDLGRGDLEGITWAVGTGMLYVAVEGVEHILEVDPDSFAVVRTFDIRRKFEEETVLAKGRDGIESIAFVPDAGHPEGGTFFVTNQAKSRKHKDDASALLEVSAPLKGGGKKAKIVAYYPMKTLDLAGLCYDAKRDLLLVVSDKENRCLEVTRTGVVLRTYALPGKGQEGVAVDAEGCLYIAQDSGGIVQYRPRGVG